MIFGCLDGLRINDSFRSKCASPACDDLVRDCCQLGSISSRESLRHRNLCSPGFHLSLCPWSGLCQGDRFAVGAFLAGAIYFIATVSYVFVDGRFYLPVLFLLVALAVLPAEWAVAQALKLRFSISTAGVLTIFVLTCIGYPSQSGFKPKRNRSQAWDALQYASRKGRSPRYEAEEEFRRVFRDAPGIVLSDIDPPYLNVLLPKAFVAAPIDDQNNYCYSRHWHYGKNEAIRLVQSGLDHSTPVYALLVPSDHNEYDVQRLPRSRVIVGDEARNPVQKL